MGLDVKRKLGCSGWREHPRVAVPRETRLSRLSSAETQSNHFSSSRKKIEKNVSSRQFSLTKSRIQILEYLRGELVLGNWCSHESRVAADVKSSLATTADNQAMVSLYCSFPSNLKCPEDESASSQCIRVGHAGHISLKIESLGTCVKVNLPVMA